MPRRCAAWRATAHRLRSRRPTARAETTRSGGPTRQFASFVSPARPCCKRGTLVRSDCPAKSTPPGGRPSLRRAARQAARPDAFGCRSCRGSSRHGVALRPVGRSTDRQRDRPPDRPAFARDTAMRRSAIGDCLTPAAPLAQPLDADTGSDPAAASWPARPTEAPAAQACRETKPVAHPSGSCGRRRSPTHPGCAVRGN